MGTVREIWRFPVKSMQGEGLAEATVDAGGIPGDRRWGVVDSSTGKVLSAKRERRLLEAAARVDGDTVVVTLPDGSEHVAGDDGASEAISRWLGREVRLEHAPDGPQRSYEMNTDAADPSSPTMEIPCPPGTFLDFAAVHVLTTASLRAMGEHYQAGSWVPARFRPTILVEHDGDGFVEDAWVGRELSVGGVRVSPFMPTVRCAMPGRAQPGGVEADLEIVRAVNRHHQGNLGVYATVAEPGTVRVGDAVDVA